MAELPVSEAPIIALQTSPSVLPIDWIDNDADLVEACQRWRQKDFLAIDTEFERVKTFYPILALIQVCDGERIALIDAPVIKNWQAFCDVMQAETVVKVMHAASEDLETLYQTCACVPKSFFDSQSALAFLNHGLSVGYAALVAQTFGVTISKDAARTDWLARPLSAEQLDYAAADVLYLYALWPPLFARIEAMQRVSWLADEASLAMTRAMAIEDADSAYRRVKQSFLLQQQSLCIAKELATWREQLARSSNTARSRILRDEAIIMLSQRQPRNWAALAGLDILHPHSLRVYGQAILEAIERGRAAKEFPPAVLRIIDVPAGKKLAAQLSDLVSTVAQSANVQAEWLMSRRIQEQLAMAIAENHAYAPGNWRGWRRELMREPLSRLLQQQSLTTPSWW